MASEKMYLYQRPKHNIIRVPERLPNGATRFVEAAVSAFQGIEYAIRGTSLKEPTFVEALRVLRKIENASHEVPALQHRYLVLKPSERKLVEQAVTKFNWSEFCTNNTIDVWLQWGDFLEGFDSESDVYADTWQAFDPLNPTKEYAEWKQQHQIALEKYNQSVANAEAAALKSTQPVGAPTVDAEAAATAPVTEQAVAAQVAATETAADSSDVSNTEA